MKKEPKIREVTVGKTTVKLDDIVRDPTGIEDILSDALTDPRLGWAERRLQQVGVRLNVFPSARDLREDQNPGMRKTSTARPLQVESSLA